MVGRRDRLELTDSQNNLLIDLCIDISKSNFDNEKDISESAKIIYQLCKNSLTTRTIGGITIPSNFNLISRIEFCINEVSLKDENFKIILSDSDYKELCKLFGMDNLEKYKGYKIEKSTN